MPLSPCPVALRNRRILIAVVASLLVAVGVMFQHVDDGCLAAARSRHL